MNKNITFLDCTLRDGGYYNRWDFPPNLVADYLQSVARAGVDVVEIGFRFPENVGFKGACAYSTEEFLNTLVIPDGLAVGVMINASDIVTDGTIDYSVLESLIPVPAEQSVLSLIRIACHVHEYPTAIMSSSWIKERGYKVGYNIMQIAGCDEATVKKLAQQTNDWPIDVLYFADSMGKLSS